MAAWTLVASVSGCQPVEDETPLWRADDQSVTLAAFGYWGGSFQWNAARASLTDAQREALSGLMLIPGVEPCLADIQEYSLTFVDGEGNERTVHANAENAACGRDSVLAIETLEPLLSTLSCVGTGKASEDLSGAPVIQAGDGCRHGFFAYAEQPARWVKVEGPDHRRPAHARVVGVQWQGHSARALRSNWSAVARGEQRER